MGDVTIRITANRLPTLPARLRQQASAAVRKAAFDIEANAKQSVPVDTGALKNSIYTVTDQGSTYGQAVGSASSANPHGHPVAEAPKPAGISAVVAVGMEYGVYVELGTRKMAARPFLGPAAEVVKPAFLAALAQLVEQG